MLWIAALLVFVFDQWTKHLIGTSYAPGESHQIIPHLLWWTYSQNTHGAFGLFGSAPVLLILLALGVLALFAFVFRDAKKRSRIVSTSLGFILGGAFGNIADRLTHWFVVDFIDFKTIWPDIFNVADSCIVVGACLLMVLSLRRRKVVGNSDI